MIPCPRTYSFLCAEGLFAGLEWVEETKTIHGIKIRRRSPSISHLLFADNCYIFTRAEENDATTITNILQLYQKASGQVANNVKTKLIFCRNSPPQVKASLANVLGVQISATPSNYWPPF